MPKQWKKEDLLKAYRTMKEIREFEERVHVEFATGKIPGFVHLYAGEEASAAGVCMNLGTNDKIVSNHRGHGHCIARGVDIDGMMAEIYGKKTGTCGGKGGSMHIADLDMGMMGANGIVGAGPPLICGAGLAAKYNSTGGVGVAFFGDGATNQGTVYEAMNLSMAWKLPCVFVIENNGYAESTSPKYTVPGIENLSDRAKGVGMPGITVDGFDFFEVYQAAGEQIERARKGEGPSLLEVKLTRYYGHFEGDAMAYRPKDEVKKIRETLDCLLQFRNKVTSAGMLTANELDAIDQEVKVLIDDSVVKAKAAPNPPLSDLLTDVYVSY